MLDKWLKDDLENLFKNGSTIVLIDESGDMANIFDKFKFEYNVYIVNSPLEELKARYDIEKEGGFNNLIYTNTKFEKLKFILEYASVNGCLQLYSLSDYVKNKLYSKHKIVINNLSMDEYKAAAIGSIGKDISYWHTIQSIGSEGILDIKHSSLEFLNNPSEYLNSMDEVSKLAFCNKIYELIGTQYIEKPAKTISIELSNAIFDNLLYSKNNKDLMAIYNSWIDSKEYNKSFNTYLANYKIDTCVNIWKCDWRHPFEEIDRRIIADFLENLNDREYKVKHKSYINRRLTMSNKLPFNITCYECIKIVFDFDTDSISQITDINSAIEFYKSKLSILDDSVRKMFIYCSNNRNIIKSIESFYKEQMTVFLDKWLSYFSDYRQNQTGTIQRIINNNSNKKTAIIVGDGISYSIANNIANKIKNTSYIFKEQHINSDFPSETENNMSQIYCADGHIEKLQQNRRTYLKMNNPDLDISFTDIEKLNNETGQLADVLVCTAKDIDELGEKLQLKALEYFDDAENSIADAINLLLQNGFKKVYLISDHGFVLTKVLTESDKIEVDFKGKYSTNERYICSDEKQNKNKLIEIEKNDKYIYFAKSMNPFKTAGVYGYSHGGLTPQELITPLFSWEKQADLNSLDIKIENKNSLLDNMGDLFSIKLIANSEKNSLFSSSRKIFINFFVDGKCIQTSEIYEIKQNETCKKEFSLNGYKQMQIQIVDANTKEILDSAIINKNQGRDLDGLL